MSGLDALFTDLASSLVGDFGAPATLSQITPGTYDPNTGTSGAGTTVNTTCSAVLDASSMTGLGYQFGPDLVQEGSQKALLAGKGLAVMPEPGDILTLAGVPWVIDAVRPTYSGAVAVLYELLVRR